jgi:prepilin-type N-terminal cleavage/methylation domain-containing protein
MRSQRGMTLVEVLIVLAIIGILANVAYPQLDSALWKSRAAVVIADYRLFEGAVVDYMSVHGVYPPNASVANPDGEFAAYMPPGFRWIKPRPWVYAYVWENWENKGHGRRLNIGYGFSLKQPDEKLVWAIEQLYDGRFEPTVYQKYTFVMQDHPNPQ